MHIRSNRFINMHIRLWVQLCCVIYGHYSESKAKEATQMPMTTSKENVDGKGDAQRKNENPACVKKEQIRPHVFSLHLLNFCWLLPLCIRGFVHPYSLTVLCIWMLSPNTVYFGLLTWERYACTFRWRSFQTMQLIWSEHIVQMMFCESTLR